MVSKIKYKRLLRDSRLAELMGIILGDGNLYKHPRTENLRITCNASELGYIRHIAKLIDCVFSKTPSVIKRNDENAVTINLYQGNICKRLGLPDGNKIINDVGVPAWVITNRKYQIKCLKGLFETDGCFQKDESNYAQYIEFKNNCKRLKSDAYKMLSGLGLNPQRGSNYVRLARKEEVNRFIKLIAFRKYIAP